MSASIKEDKKTGGWEKEKRREPEPHPRLLVPLIPSASLGPRWEGPRRAGSSLGVLPSGSVPPSFSPDDLGEGDLQLYPPGPTGAGAADAGDFQEEEAGRGRKG